MKTKYCFVLLSLSLSWQLEAQNFNTADIPDSLLKNANAVTRYEEHVFEIKSPGKAVEHERHVYTILNEDGDFLAKYLSGYDKDNSLDNVSATMYDAKGKELKHAKKKDMEDRSGSDDETLMTDTRYKVYSFYNRVYPYTVDFEEDDDLNGLKTIGRWMPQDLNHTSVQYSKYVIIAPKDYQLRYMPVNCSYQPVITEEKEKKIYTWEIRNLHAKGHEVLEPYASEFLPYVLFGLSDFETAGFKGDMSTWASFSAFIYQLLKGRDVLPDDIKEKVHSLIDHLTDPRQKISALYEFLQKNTRYISIQFGIGGWQPFDATYVATRRYGDCKALSNYMVALLKEAGITGKSVVIRAENDAAPIVPDFSCSQFNHVIACVPLGKDTVWLECTDHELPAGYLSSFTANRWGLLVDEKGGGLVRTPRYTLNDNVQVRKIFSILSADGDLIATVNSLYKAEQQDHLEMDLEYKSRDEMLKILKSQIDLPTYDVAKFDYREDKSKIPPTVDESLELHVANYAQVSGKRVFINPNILSREPRKLKKEENRKYNILLKDEYKHIDSVEIKIPEGYLPEAQPSDTRIESRFGKYFSTVKIMPDKILYYRYQEQFSGEFPAKDYDDLLNYYEIIYKADRSKIVLVKKE